MTEESIVPLGNIDQSAQYHVSLALPVKWNNHTLLPLQAHTFSGRVLAAIMQETPDAIYSSAAVVG